MTGIRPPTADTLRAYQRSRYSAGGMVVRIGFRPMGVCPPRSAGTLVLIGASNPGGRRRLEGWNGRMTDRLRLALRRLRFVEGTGSLGRWSEVMLMAPMDARRAVVLARRFGQNAIILVRARQRSRLKLLQTDVA